MVLKVQSYGAYDRLRPVCDLCKTCDNRRQSKTIARLVLEIVNSHTNKIGWGRATTIFEHIQTSDAAVEDTRKLIIRLK